MAAVSYKRLSSITSRSVILYLCGISLVFLSHVTTASELSKGNGKGTTVQDKPLLDTTIVYPSRGLTTGPPVNMLEAHGINSQFETSHRAQRSQTDNAQAFQNVSGSSTDVVYGNDTAEDEGRDMVERPLATRSQRLQDKNEGEDSAGKAFSPINSNCVSGDSLHASEHPAEDTVGLYDAVDKILEHVIGVDDNINDPEEIRMRAYVGERQSYGVQVILQDETHFWESSLEGDAFEPVVDAGDFVPVNTKSSFAHRQEDVDDEAAKDNDTHVTVQEGSRLRLVCNVTGVPTYLVEWRRAANLSFPGGASVVGGRSVLLDYVGREDAGIYSCTATTPSGHSHSSALSIRVQYAPVVGVWARDVDTGNVELGCLAEGRPRPSSAWYINNTIISPSHCPRNLKIRSTVLSSHFVLSTLSLDNISIKDFAYYHCRASNPVGVSRAYVMVHDNTGVLNLEELAELRPVKYPAPLENPRLSSFLLGMVPPLYIGLYIIAYLGCYKTSISGLGGHGRFGAGVDLEV